MKKKAMEMMKQAMMMMEQAYSMDGESEGSEHESEEGEMELKTDGSSSSIGNAGTGGESDDIESKKQKKNMIIASMKRKQY